MVQIHRSVISRKITERVRLRQIGLLKLILGFHVDNVLIDKPVALPSTLSNLVATPQQSLSGQSSLVLVFGPTLNLLRGYRVGCRREVINISHAQDKFLVFFVINLMIFNKKYVLRIM